MDNRSEARRAHDIADHYLLRLLSTKDWQGPSDLELAEKQTAWRRLAWRMEREGL